jgi:hypothetical protein
MKNAYGTIRLIVLALVLGAFVWFVSGCAGGYTRELSDFQGVKKDTSGKAPEALPETGEKTEWGGVSAGARMAPYTHAVHRGPELRVRTASGEVKTLPLLSQDSTVVISGHRARVVLDMVFFNPHEKQAAGQLFVALPENSSPFSLATFDGEGIRELPGTDEQWPYEALFDPSAPAPENVLSRNPVPAETWQASGREVNWGEAKQAVIVEPDRPASEPPSAEKREPATSRVPEEWAQVRRFTAEIPGIPPGQLKRVVFIYDQTLVPREGAITYTLPTPPSSEARIRATLYEVGPTISGSTVTHGEEVVKAGRTRYGYKWSIPVSESTKEVVFQGKLRNPDLTVLSGAAEAINNTLATVVATPDLPAKPQRVATGKGMFLIDTSYSTTAKGKSSSLAGKSVQVLREVLSSDRSLEEFAIVCFDTRPTLLTPGFVENTASARKHYLEMVESVHREGATNFDAVLSRLRANALSNQADTLFLLSDGRITWGGAEIAQMQERYEYLFSKRWICYSFGSIPYNRPLFDALTHAGGMEVHIGPVQDITAAARAHRRQLYRLENVYSTTQEEITVSGDPQTIYPGEALLIAARIKPTERSFRLVLEIDGRTVEYNVPLYRQEITDHLAARAWADIFVDSLLRNPEQWPVETIFTLSRYFSLTNQYASFMIVESEEEARTYEQQEAAFDYRRIGSLLRPRSEEAPLAPLAEERRQQLHRFFSGMGIPVPAEGKRAQLVYTFLELQDLDVWKSPAPGNPSWSPALLLKRPPVGREDDAALSIIEQARRLYEEKSMQSEEDAGGSSDNTSGQEDRGEEGPALMNKEAPLLRQAQALRVLSSVGEVNPEEPRMLKAIGFLCMEWQFYDAALSIFSKLRAMRPFELQNMLLEAIARGLKGDLAGAAVLFEEVLQRPSPRFAEFLHRSAARLYSDILRVVLEEYPDHPQRRLWQERLEELAVYTDGRVPEGRVLLFWNQDKSDIDLIIRESRWSDVWFEHPTSRTGGILYGDNTKGLGPELYEHPRLSLTGFEVYVDYYASLSEPGPLPPATAVLTFTWSRREGRYHMRWYTTFLEEEAPCHVVNWKRVR